MNKQETIEKCLDAIMGLKGVEEFKETVWRLHTFLKNKEAYSLTDVLLPNYLCTAKRGGGISTLVNAFAEYLYAARAIEFCGTVKYFEFKLEYMYPESFFSELTRLDNTISSYAGYNRFYKGLICINIDDEWVKWLERINEDHFIKFLNYIVSNEERLLVIFCIYTDDEKVIETIKTALLSHMRIESISLRFPDVNELVELFESRYIKDKGLFFTKNAKALLSETIEEIVAGENFNGFKSIAQLADDILYNIFTTDLGSKKDITVDMLSCYDKNSNYVKRVKTCIDTKKVVGFTERCI